MSCISPQLGRRGSDKLDIFAFTNIFASLICFPAFVKVH